MRYCHPERNDLKSNDPSTSLGMTEEIFYGSES